MAVAKDDDKKVEARKAVSDKNVGIAGDADAVDTSNADEFAPTAKEAKADAPAYSHERFPGEAPRTVTSDGKE